MPGAPSTGALGAARLQFGHHLSHHVASIFAVRRFAKIDLQEPKTRRPCLGTTEAALAKIVVKNGGFHRLMMHHSFSKVDRSTCGRTTVFATQASWAFEPTSPVTHPPCTLLSRTSFVADRRAKRLPRPSTSGFSGQVSKFFTISDAFQKHLPSGVPAIAKLAHKHSQLCRSEVKRIVTDTKLAFRHSVRFLENRLKTSVQKCFRTALQITTLGCVCVFPPFLEISTCLDW